MNPTKLLVVFLFVVRLADAADTNRPNIVLMMADDMGMGDCSAYQDFTKNSDADQLHTPAMERLACMGVRLTDAHTPSSRCSPTRYSLLTGRYPWRSRLKHWVLFGAQGDPLIEPDRPTIASVLQDNGYQTAMVGKWHVGLRYRNSEGLPAAGFVDADLKMPLADSPLDHGFDYCRFTSRSHGTSGPQPGKKNTPNQTVGPGHIYGRKVIGATTNDRQLTSKGPTAYVLNELGSRHSDHAMEYLNDHVTGDESQNNPFFLYYASNSNHAPYTPDKSIGGVAVTGAGKHVDGSLAGTRGDFVYENDVALGRLLDWLETTEDPRSPGHKLISNTIVIFTSDNGAEIKAKSATGPFRSNKASCYEGGHRVPFIATWPAAGIGDGNQATPGRTSSQTVCLTDIFATFCDALGVDLPDNVDGQKGAEDSISVLEPLQSNVTFSRPFFVNDHKENKSDPAVAMLRFDNPDISGTVIEGQWKLFFDAQLLRSGIANPIELYDLKSDRMEANNRISEPELQPLVQQLAKYATRHRTAGGHRLAEAASNDRVVFDWTKSNDREHLNLAKQFDNQLPGLTVTAAGKLTMTIDAVGSNNQPAGRISVNARGLGLAGGEVKQVDNCEGLVIRFNEDVIVESAAIVAGNGTCGGFYQVENGSKLAIYCIDADIDAKDQSGILSDLGILKAGQTLRLDSTPHFPSENAGRWRLRNLTVRRLRSGPDQ